MLLRHDAILGLPVITRSGISLGRVVGLMVDTESGMILQYQVRARGWVAMILPHTDELLIHHTQVIALEEDRMIVEEGSGGTPARKQRRVLAPQGHPNPVL
ncbi:PRC-barrel domain-containing protein [Candidatus Uhrbacteria bacterium]|nr:PRC-barrel domain-containing protein [Candidatus Uhrbacteria bacterium]